MKVNEIFTSIEGEGIKTGEIVTFIRLSGCNLKCLYCDTLYAEKGIEISIDRIIKHIKTKCVTITGGEPLLRKDLLTLIEKLLKKEKEVNIETNGSLNIKKYLKDNVTITMDWKTKSSGQENKMLEENLSLLRENDVLKFVCGKDDFKEIKEVLQKDIKSYIYLSPIFGECDPKKLVEFAKTNYRPKMRVQLQLHKIIWDPNERGV